MKHAMDGRPHMPYMHTHTCECAQCVASMHTTPLTACVWFIPVTLCNAVASITAMCVGVSLPCCHLFFPIESSTELYTHNTPVFLS